MPFVSPVGILSAAKALDRAYFARTRLGEGHSSPRTGSARGRNWRVFTDPHGRYRIEVPSEWRVSRWASAALQLEAPNVGSLVRVDVLPPGADFWKRLIASLRAGGFVVRSARRTRGLPERVRGLLRLGEVRFLWDAYAWPLDGGTVILTEANVDDPSRSLGLERYEDHVLAQVRRRLRVPAPRVPGRG